MNKIFLYVSPYSMPPKPGSVNNSATVWPINNSVPKKKKKGVQSNNSDWAYPLSVMLNVYIHNCVLRLSPWGIREWCCGELEKAGTGRRRSEEAAVELRLEAGPSRWWPVPSHSEPAGRSHAPHPRPAWLRCTASYSIQHKPECLLSSHEGPRWTTISHIKAWSVWTKMCSVQLLSV